MKRRIICIAVVVAFLLGIMIYLYVAEPTGQTTVKDIKSAPSISARQAVLIDEGTGEVLYRKGASERTYPASTTKIMTALVVLELCQTYGIDMKDEVEIPKEAVGAEGSSLYLKAGEEKTIEDLLYGMMLQSGNDGAIALAVCLGGTSDHFVSLMNETASRLGCMDTNFVNPHGLFDEEHYTTAIDLATISRAAMSNDVFREIVGTQSWGNYENKNKTLRQYKGGTGIKIGYTEKSGRTLVASATRGDKSLIAVVLNDGNWFQDAYALMDYGFSLKGENNETVY